METKNLQPSQAPFTYVRVQGFLQSGARVVLAQAVAPLDAGLQPPVVHRLRQELITPVLPVLRHLPKAFHHTKKRTGWGWRTVDGDTK